jgi:nucleoid DNA-binding protein
MTLTKNDLVKALAKENVFQKMRSIEIIETLMGIIKSGLALGEDILISGFRKLCVKDKRER